MYKRIAVISILVLSALSALSAESTREVTSKNEFGGSTYESQYSNGDKFFNDLGIVKSIIHYDPENKIRFVEYFYSEAYSAQKNFHKKIEYYNDKQKLSKGEYFYTEAFAKERGYNRAIDTFDNQGKAIQSEYFYTEDFVKKNSYYYSFVKYAKGYITEWTYIYNDDFIKKWGFSKRTEIYVYDSYGKDHVKESVFYDTNNLEIKREKK